MKALIYIIFILFSLQTFAQTKSGKPKKKPRESASIDKKEKEQHSNFAIAEEIEEAKFLGTEEELVTFFMDNIVFSDSAVVQNLEGQITIKFIVNESGTPTEIEIIKGLGFGIDEQVINLTPKLKYKSAHVGELPVKMEQLITIPLRAYKKQ